MVYTRKQIITVIRQCTSVECPIVSDKAGIQVTLPNAEQAAFFVTGMAVLRNVRAVQAVNIVNIPLNASGHTLRAERAQFDNVTIRESD